MWWAKIYGGGGGGGGPPCVFAEVGKKAKDVLSKGLSTGHMMLFFSHLTSTGASLSTTPILTSQGLLMATVSSSFKAAGVKADLSFTSPTNQITAETTYEDLAPGLKFSLSTAIPDGSQLGKAELVYRREAAAVTTTVKGLKTTPILECSANLGSEKFSVGGSAVYDTQTNVLSNMVAGFGYVACPMSLSLLYNPKKGDKNLTLYYSHEVNPNLSVAMHVDYEQEARISNSEIGGSYKLDPQTSLKAKISNVGVVSTLLEYEPKPLVTLGLSAEFNGKLLWSTKPKLGFNVTVLSI